MTCIANLSNDEVFTPPEFANRMLDTLAGRGLRITAARIFGRTRRALPRPLHEVGRIPPRDRQPLTDGLEFEIPDLDERVEHILTEQVYGIGTTYLTSLLARRSLYCSKHAQGEYSIAKSFATDAGNIWFELLEHVWIGPKCKYCGTPRAILDRGEGLETHAYAFVHTDDIKARLAEMFGGHMQFDVIIGNPPYQLDDGGYGTSAAPIYQLFIEKALDLDPRFAVFVTPSRWMAGGKGLDKYREAFAFFEVRTGWGVTTGILPR